MIVQDLWQVCYQILPLSWLKKLMKLNVNVGIIIQKCEACGIKYKDFECCLEYTDVKDDLTVYKCLCCGREFQKN